MLTVNHLTIEVANKCIVDDVSLALPRGKIVALVGGSGSGKTTIGLGLMKLLPQALRQTRGEINSDGKIGFIFQEPLQAFDPLFRVGYQLREVGGIDDKRIAEVLNQVQLNDHARILASYPHQLSGGQRQRMMIAQAIINNPAYVIADEPTSSLDVTLQVEIIALLRHLAKDLNIGILLISHDLGMVGHLADEVIVLQEGKIIEQGEVKQIMNSPRHVYTKQLLEAF